MRSRAQAFTLTELLVVVGIIGMLVGIMVPTFLGVADLGREANCLSNLTLISKAAQQYMGAYQGLLPKNDPESEQASYPYVEPRNLLEGKNSTRRWWCNKVFVHGEARPKVYICPGDPGRESDADPVKCGYGFNNSLTDPDEDAVKTVFEIKDPEWTALIGHCSDFTREPAIAEEMARLGGTNSARYWPIGHVAKYDQKAEQRVGRCGFIMASGEVKTLTFSQAVLLETEDNHLALFRKKGPRP